MIIQDTGRPILFFDGVCNLCNYAVQFVIRHDRKKLFLFASLQSDIGKEAIKQVEHTTGDSPESMILFYKGKYYTQSGAALYMSRFLGGLWPLLYAAIIIPPFIRNAVYNVMARNRYKWFGKSDECMVPTPELKSRFLSE